MAENRDLFLGVDRDQFMSELVGDIAVPFLDSVERGVDLGKGEEFFPRRCEDKIGAQFVAAEIVVAEIEDFLRCPPAFERGGWLGADNPRCRRLRRLLEGIEPLPGDRRRAVLYCAQ